jgi:MFS family permease
MSRAAHADDRPARAGGRLFITGLGIGQICSWGSLYYSFPLIAEAMGSDLGWSKPDLYGAATIGLLLSGVAAYPVGSAIDRGHGRTIVAGASVLAGILLIAWSQVESIAVLYILLAGIGCLQAALLTESAFAVVSRRFGAANARGGIVALSLWAGFASTVFVPLIQLLLDHFGWRETLIVLGSVNIVLCGALYAVVIDPAADASPPIVVQASPMVGSRAVGWALKSPIFWALAIALTAYWAVFSGFIFHAYPLLLERGFDTQTVVFAIAVIGPAQVAGRISIWTFAPAVQIRVVGSLGRCRISSRLSRTDGYTASVCGDRSNRCDLWRSKWDHDNCSWPRGTGNADTRCLRGHQWRFGGADDRGESSSSFRGSTTLGQIGVVRSRTDRVAGRFVAACYCVLGFRVSGHP